MRAARQGQLGGIKRLVLAGAPDVRQKQVEVELLWQVESRRAARGGHLEGRRGDGGGGFSDGDEAKRGEHGGREADDKHAGAVRAAKADVPLAGQLALALLIELEDDAENAKLQARSMLARHANAASSACLKGRAVARMAR